MKRRDLLTIKPHNYDLLLNEKAKGSPEARTLLEEMIREHKRFVGLCDYVIQLQYKCTQNIFAYGTEREPELLAWLAGNPVIDPIDLDFSNTDPHSEEENMLDDLEKDEEKESDQNSDSTEKKKVTSEDKGEKPRGKNLYPSARHLGMNSAKAIRFALAVKEKWLLAEWSGQVKLDTI